MVAHWKIFYTDSSSVLWSDVDAVDGSPARLPTPQRVGVHSVIQEMAGDPAREVIEQYHYLFSDRSQQWVGVGIDGLFDYLVNDFDDILCVLHGRASATSDFWTLRDIIKADTDIPGGIDTAAHPPVFGSTYDYSRWSRTNPIYSQGWNVTVPYTGMNWGENARHRAYADEFTDPPPRGSQEFYH